MGVFVAIALIVGCIIWMLVEEHLGRERTRRASRDLTAMAASDALGDWDWPKFTEAPSDYERAAHRRTA